MTIEELRTIYTFVILGIIILLYFEILSFIKTKKKLDQYNKEVKEMQQVIKKLEQIKWHK